MKKGFTLVELLAVIIVIGVIATIAIPIFLNIINSTKTSSSGISITNYMKAVKLSVENYSANNNGVIPQGTYRIENSGKVLNNDTVTIKISSKGFGLESGTIVITDTGDAILKNGKAKDINKIYNYLDKQITSLDLVTGGDGLYLTDSNRYIYRGSNPNNYIWLDENGDNIKTEEELYRIISYENDGTIKVIRNTSIGNMAWDTSDTVVGTRQNEFNSYCNYNEGNSTKYYGCNAWGSQYNTYFENDLLDSNFYYKYYINNTTTSLSKNPSLISTVTDDSSLNKYLNVTWLDVNSNLSNYIEEHFFNVGGPMYYSNYIGGDQGLSKEKYHQILNAWKGKLGLINIIEYMEASTNDSCTSVYSNFYYNTDYYKDSNGDGNKEQTNDNWPCSNDKNWIFRNDSMWFISSVSSQKSSVWNINSLGSFSKDYLAYKFLGVRPTFYIKPTLSMSGLGTIDNPYILK